jgi:hypothetical protein
MTKVYLVTARQGQSIYMKVWNMKIFDTEEKAKDYIIDMTDKEKSKVNNKNEPIFYHYEILELE